MIDIQKAQLDLNDAALEWFKEHKSIHLDVYEQRLEEACKNFLTVLESFEWRSLLKKE